MRVWRSSRRRLRKPPASSRPDGAPFLRGARGACPSRAAPIPAFADRGARDVTLFLQQMLNGLLDGVYYLLIALGLSLIFSLGGIVNLAHGAFYALGAYLTIVISPYLGFSGAFGGSAVAFSTRAIKSARACAGFCHCRSASLSASAIGNRTTPLA